MNTDTLTPTEPSVFEAQPAPAYGPRVYVGTYAKYNSGSIAGAWLDLEDLGSADAFAEACRELHKDEADPELMFQDFEGFPRAFYGESSLDDRVWDWIDADESEREIWALYLDNVDDDGDLDTARDAYMGSADTEADFAAQWLEDTGGLEGVPEHLANYFDYEAYARDMGYDGVTFVREGGVVHAFDGNR